MPRVPVSSDVGLAAARLRNGGLIGLPTETGYGLGALANAPATVERIFEVKGRPRNHPLIVDLRDAGELDRWGQDVPHYARQLAAGLWPGPVTLVLVKHDSVLPQVTGGAPTVALRVPNHAVALSLLALLDSGLAAPSANLFGRVSPTQAEDVVEELAERLDPARDLVLDGGPSQVGIESTIIDCTARAPRILRQGAVTSDDVAAVGAVAPVAGASQTPAPGTLPSHYAPRTRVVPLALEEARRYCASEPQATAPGHVVPEDGDGLLAPVDLETPLPVVRLAAFDNNDDYARCLYQGFRRADHISLKRIIVVEAEPSGIGLAINDRTTRAAFESR